MNKCWHNCHIIRNISNEKGITVSYFDPLTNISDEIALDLPY